MKILFYDIIQLSNAPGSLRSPALADRWDGSSLVITLDRAREINCVGIGYTDAGKITMSFNPPQLQEIEGDAASPVYAYDGGTDLDPVNYDVEIESDVTVRDGSMEQSVMVAGNGLYRVIPVVADRIAITTDGSYIGRFAAGVAVDLPTAMHKEPGFASTGTYRKTLSGQVIPGAGGYAYRTVSVDTRYKINNAALSQIEAAYNGQIGLGYPYFLLFDKESRRLPFIRLYAKDTKTEEYVFQGGINKYLFSRKFEFEECF
ncbi:MAG: hypothetical protein LBH85_01645 [Treponema sp.]|jgi:hypothetical protein|nr:hypothetical protein [Treponema sp.]